jgi:hypothetical protein
MNSISLIAQNFIRMNTWTDVFSNSGFVDDLAHWIRADFPSYRLEASVIKNIKSLLLLLQKISGTQSLARLKLWKSPIEQANTRSQR